MNVEWEALSWYLPSTVTGGRPRVDDRRVLNGIVWKIRAGAAWRDVPARYGSWQSIYTRIRRWALDGTFERMLAGVQADADAAGDIDWLVSVDSKIVRSHQHAAGAKKGRRREELRRCIDIGRHDEWMTSKGQPSGGRRRARLNWRGRAAGALVSLAVAMTGNLISADFGYPAVAAALVVGAVLAASTWVRQLPTQAPLVRYVIRLLLLAAAVAAVTAALGPQAWAPWATIIAALLTIAVVLIPVDVLTALSFLFGTAFIGTGVAYIGAVAVPFLLTEGKPLDGVVGIAVGTVAIGAGCVFLIGGDTPGGAMAIRAQVANKEGAFLAGGNRYVAIVGGVACIAMGFALLTVGDSLGGTAALVGGVAFIGYGIFRRLAGAATIVVGVACILLGCAWLADTGILLGGAAISMGAAQIGFGVSHLIYHGPPPQWRDWWTRMTTPTQHPAGAEPAGTGQNDSAQRTAPTSETSTATVSSPRSSRSGSGVTGNPPVGGRRGSTGSPRTGPRPRRRRR